MIREQRLEAEERARHKIVRSFSQPGNNYRTEVECRCGVKGFAVDHPLHVEQAVTQALTESPPDQLPDPGLTRQETAALLSYEAWERVAPAHRHPIEEFSDVLLAANGKLRAALSQHDSEGSAK